MSNDDLKMVVTNLFRHPDTVESRVYLETYLMDAFGVQPRSVTKLLGQLVDENRLVVTPLPLKGRRIANAYSTRVLPEKRISEISELLQRKQQAFDPEVLREAGEAYARALFIRSGLFHVPQRRFLGIDRRYSPDHPLDLAAKYRDEALVPGRLVVEVKNQREHFYPRSSVFERLLRKTVACGGMPVLVAAHLSPEAIVFCARVGIGVLHLTRQVAPHSQRRLIEGVGAITGPIRIQYVRVGRPLIDDQNHEIARDLNVVCDRYWLVTAAERWNSNKEWLVGHLAPGATCMRFPTVIKKIYAQTAAIDVNHSFAASSEPSAVCKFFMGDPKANQACNSCGATWRAHVEQTGARILGDDDSAQLPLRSHVVRNELDIDRA